MLNKDSNTNVHRIRVTSFFLVIASVILMGVSFCMVKAWSEEVCILKLSQIGTGPVKAEITYSVTNQSYHVDIPPAANIINSDYIRCYVWQDASLITKWLGPPKIMVTLGAFNVINSIIATIFSLGAASIASFNMQQSAHEISSNRVKYSSILILVATLLDTGNLVYQYT